MSPRPAQGRGGDGRMAMEPFVMCLTNAVAANFTANCLLAVGAKPAMVAEPDEAAELAGQADAILVNLGTVDERQVAAMRAAVEVATRRRVPWVLDPVGVQALSFRRRLALELIARSPSLIRGNSEEIGFLKKFAAGFPGPVPVLATGEVDRVEEAGREPVSVAGGVPMLQTVTATGCAQGGLCAAFLGRGMSPFEAGVAAAKLMKRAGEVAAARERAPGSFQVALVDALWSESRSQHEQD